MLRGFLLLSLKSTLFFLCVAMVKSYDSALALALGLGVASRGELATR